MCLCCFCSLINYFECLFLCDLIVELSVWICIEMAISPNNLLKFILGCSSFVVGEELILGQTFRFPFRHSCGY